MSVPVVERAAQMGIQTAMSEAVLSIEGDRDRIELGSLRHRDSDMSIKGAGVLGFAGLMLAAALVFLTAPTESTLNPTIVGLKTDWATRVATVCATGAMLAVLVLGGAAYIAMKSIRASGNFAGKYGKDALLEYKSLLERRHLLLERAETWTFVGVGLLVSSMLLAVAFKNIGPLVLS